MKHYDEKSVVNHLNRFTNVSVSGNTINILRNGIGIHTAGKVDYLVNYHHYVIVRK